MRVQGWSGSWAVPGGGGDPLRAGEQGGGEGGGEDLGFLTRGH